MKKQIKLYIIEKNLNFELHDYLKTKYHITYNIYECNVVIVAKITNVSIAFDIVDFALSLGKEIICIKGRFSKENYVANNLIKNGALWV